VIPGPADRCRALNQVPGRGAMLRVRTVPPPYPPLALRVTTPRLALHGATDDWLEQLIPIVREGVAVGDDVPFDDPMSLYAESPEREWRWLRGIWAGRGRVDATFWRLYFVVVVDGAPVGMQDLIGIDFGSVGTVATFSWLAPSLRSQGIGIEMRSAALHLAFAGLDAKEASSEAFVDNEASNRVSCALGYEPNGTDWATRRGEPAQLARWRLTRESWARRQRPDIELAGVDACRLVLGIGVD
jgi:RimJ/RimL family protein N-acetyltransferase